MIDVLEESARLGGSLTLITRSGEDKRSYLELVQEARALGAGLGVRGIGPGARVGLLAVPTMEFVVSLLATMAAQACAVLLPAPPMLGRSWWADRIRSLVEFASVKITLGPRTPATSVPHVDLSELDENATLHPVPGDGEGMILFTSGTTGDPRGVVLSRRRIVRRVMADAGRRTSQGDRFLSWRDLGSSSGIYPGLLTPLASGPPACVMESALFRKAPERWLIEISRRRATISGGPNFAFGVAAQRLASGIPERIDLSSWRIADCAGERIDAATMERFIELARPHGFDQGGFLPRYALSEAGIISSTELGGRPKIDKVDLEGLARRLVMPPRDDHGCVRVVSSGRIREGAVVRIVDDRGRQLGEREVGEVLVSTPWLTLGYLNDPEETERCIKNGWIHTGDLGYLADGELYITGRSKNVIIIRGRNFNSDDLERALQAVDGIAPGGVAVVGRPSASTEEIFVFAETDAPEDRHAAISMDIRKKLWGDFGLAVKDVVLVRPGSLPRTSAGKLRHEVLRSEFVSARVAELRR